MSQTKVTVCVFDIDQKDSLGIMRKIATVRAGGLEEGQGMGQTPGNAAIYGRLANVSLTGLEVFFFVAGGFGSFFRVVPLSS